MTDIAYPKLWVPYEVLKAADLNAEFGAVSAVVNGGITDSNISPLAAIWGSKIANYPHGIANLQLNDQCVSKRNLQPGIIDQTTISNNSIGTDQIIDGSIQKIDIGVSQTIWGFGSNSMAAPLHNIVANNEIVCVDLGPWTSRGGVYFVFAALHLTVTLGVDPGPMPNVIARIRIGGFAGQPDGTMLAQYSYSRLLTTPAAGLVAAPCGIFLYAQGYGASGLPNHNLKLTGLVDYIPGFADINDGWITVIEPT